MTSWHDRRPERERGRWREQVLDLLPLAVVLVALFCFLAFWGQR